jgi:hypothetical protein
MIAYFLSFAFLFATLFTMGGNKTLKNKLMKELNPSEKKEYEEIINMRKTIYFQGLILGFIISIFFIVLTKQYNTNKQSILITSLAITMFVNYLYYILYPKKKYMISILDSKRENEAWLNIYRNMQVRYHYGIIFGILTAGLLQYKIIF